MLVGTKCLESNAPGTFFVSWFLATPNISQVVYLAIYQWTTGDLTHKIWGWKKQQKSLKKRTHKSEVFARVGFTLTLPPRR